MSKKTKTASKEKRAKEKRNRKAANKARYATMRDQGINTKSYRATRNAGVRKIRVFRTRVRHKRMSDVLTTPVPQVLAEGTDANNKWAFSYLEERKLTWRQAHNQVSAKVFMRQLARR